MRAPALAFSSLCWLAGCGADKFVVEPHPLDGKADVANRVQDQGELELGVARTGAFRADLEFHGFHLRARAGAIVTIDNTHLGTASALDSTLFVYGPRTDAGFGTDAIAFDDDSGWGRHARLSKLRLDAAGEYLVVLGTADARGRGHYRLEARCENGACDLPPALAACAPALADGIQRCMAVQIAEGDLEGDHTTSYADAIATCTDGEALGAIRDAACAATPAPDYCALDFESFYTTHAPACAADLGARTGLCGAYLDDALARTVEGMWFTSESDYRYDIVRWPGQGAPTAASVRALSGLPASSKLATRTFANLFEWRGRPEDADMDDYEREDARRHRHLRRVLEGNLTDTLVVRIGEVQIRVFLVGKTSCGELAGVASTSIET